MFCRFICFCLKCAVGRLSHSSSTFKNELNMPKLEHEKKDSIIRVRKIGLNLFITTHFLSGVWDTW